GDRFIDAPGLVAKGILEVAVVVPLARGDLDKANPRFHQAARQKALPAEPFGGLFADAIERLGRRRFVGDVDQLGEIFLHAECQLERLDGSLNAGVILVAFESFLIKRFEEVKLHPLGIRRLPGVADIADAAASAAGSAGTAAAKAAEAGAN